MKLSFVRCSVSILFLFFAFFNCKNTVDPKAGKAPEAPMPADAKSAKVSLVDVNCWTEGDMFYAVGVVDSREPQWAKIWLEMGVVDAQNQIVLQNKDSFCLVSTHADALPPNGRTAFMASWKLADLKGTPDSIALKGARFVEKTAGPILIATNIGGGIKFMTLDTATSESRELYWSVSGTIENPLPLTLNEPAISILVYGNDNRLWLANNLSFNVDTALVRMDKYGPMFANEKRKYGFNVHYDNLPTPVRTSRIGKIDVLGYEKRPD